MRSPIRRRKVKNIETNVQDLLEAVQATHWLAAPNIVQYERQDTSRYPVLHLRALNVRQIRSGTYKGRWVVLNNNRNRSSPLTVFISKDFHEAFVYANGYALELVYRMAAEHDVSPEQIRWIHRPRRSHPVVW